MIKKLLKFLIYFLFSISFCFNYNVIESEEKRAVTLSFVGDVFIQESIYNSYYDFKRKRYTFSEDIFNDILEFLKKDFSFIVIDTPVASNIYSPSGYPLYNAPVEILDIFKKVGFNIMITSGNHSLDKGEKGVLETINNIKKRGLFYVGTNQSYEESKKYLILEKNNIRIGILAYTFSTNGIQMPRGKEYLINMIDEKRIKRDLEIIKTISDFVIVYLHWGDIEYSDSIENKQRVLANKIINWGADLIVGSHPHSIKPYENINGKWCFYSIGNFFTDQYRLKKPQAKFGLILNFSLIKINGKIFMKDNKVIPIFILREKLKDKYRYKIIRAEKIKELQNIIEDKLYYDRLKKLIFGNS